MAPRPGNERDFFLMPQKPLYGPGVHIRHDWRMWIRHDFARWLKPGVDPADVIPGLAPERAEQEAKRAREEAARAAEDEELAAFIEYQRRFTAAIEEEMKEVNAAMAQRRRRLAEEEAKYSPSQPRVPKRNPGGGQWTRIGGGSGQSPTQGVAQPMGSVDIGNLSGSSETEGLFNIGGTGTDSANSSDGVLKVAAADSERFYTPVLAEEDDIGGHSLSRHSKRTDSALIDWLNSDYKRIRTGNLEITEFPEAEGTFQSDGEANDLVSQVLQRNKDRVDKVAAGKNRGDTLQERFEFVTGREAFRPNGDSEPYIRDTYSVRVVIRHDTRSWRGYRVHTAYPVNDR
jgi:hypothetical protein